MMNQLVIGICGQIGAGKDETANIMMGILENRRIPYLPYKMAFPLKEISQFVFDIPESLVEDRIARNEPFHTTYGNTLRKVYQLLGTESFRDVFDPNIWVDFAARHIAKSGRDIAVISDIRFPNEAKWVKENGFLIEIDASQREGFNPPEESHASESGTGETPDFVIQNYGELEDLVNEVAPVLESILECYTSANKAMAAIMDEVQSSMSAAKHEALLKHRGIL